MKAIFGAQEHLRLLIAFKVELAFFTASGDYGK